MDFADVPKGIAEQSEDLPLAATTSEAEADVQILRRCRLIERNNILTIEIGYLLGTESEFKQDGLCLLANMGRRTD